MVLQARWKVRWTWGKVLVASSWVVVAGLAFYWGRSTWTSPVQAAAPDSAPMRSDMPPVASVPPPASAAMSDYAREPVAYIYGTIPITRADLGQYLIERFGADRLELCINHRIIEHACQEKGIEVTAGEVDAALNDDLKGLNVNKVDFVKKVLKHYNKTLYEWREDVIKPRLQLEKLVRDRVTVTDDDLHKCFEAYYGERVRCKVIMWERTEAKLKQMRDLYAKLRDDPAEFDRQARMQPSPTLSSAGGLMDPIGHHTVGNDEVEKTIFSLQPGELSLVQQTPEGVCVFKCVERIPPDTSKRLQDVQPVLEQEILRKKIQVEIPQFFAQLRKQADPHRLLAGYKTQSEVEKEVEEELHMQDQAEHNKKLAPPVGN